MTAAGGDPFATWSEHWFGCWREFGRDYERCPAIETFVDESWTHPRHDDLVAYLSTAPVVATTSRTALPWALGPGDGRSTVSYRSDGTWLWLDDLDYYVAQHGVRLPDTLVAAIETRAYAPPDELTADIDDLPWPPVG